MKYFGLLAWLLPWIVGASSLHEASTSYDLKDIRPFFERVSTLVDAGFDKAAAGNLAQFVADTPIEEKRQKNLTVIFHAAKTPLTFRVHMDDADSPSIYFFTPNKALAEAIQDEMVKYGNDLGQ